MKVLHLTNESVEEQFANGYTLDYKTSYYNPENVFNEIHLLYHYHETINEQKYGWYLHKRSGLPLIREFMMVIDGIKIVKKYDIAIIRGFNNFRCGIIGILIKLFTRKPLIISIHNDYHRLWITKKLPIIIRYGLEIAERVSMRFCDEVWVLTSYLEKYAKDRLARRTWLNPNKVKLNIFNNEPEQTKSDDKFRILFVGRLDTQKNILTLIDVINELNNDIELTIVGRNQMDKSVLKRMGPNIKYIEKLDHDTELPKYMKSVNCACLPSYTEGFGIVLVEFQAAGLPIIASDIPETKDIVNHNNALLFNPNKPEELKQCILKLKNDLNLQQTLSNKSLESSKKFDWYKLSSLEAERYKIVVGKQ